GQRPRHRGDAEAGGQAEVDDTVLAGEPLEVRLGDRLRILDLAAGLVDREGAAEAEQRLARELVFLALLGRAREAALDEEEVDGLDHPLAAGAADELADPGAAGGGERVEEPLELAGGAGLRVVARDVVQMARQLLAGLSLAAGDEAAGHDHRL